MLDDEQERRLRASAERRLSRATDPLERVRLFCLQRGATGILALARVYRRMDYNRNGELSYEEFVKGLRDSGMDQHLDAREMKELFQEFDKDFSGTISYEEFLRAIRPSLCPSRLSIVDRAFRKLDRDIRGVVTYRELAKAYSVQNHPEYRNGQCSERELCLRFLANFEVAGNPEGRVSKEEFVDYYTGVSASIDEDSYFDLMVRLAWKL
ncbi:hypothetical protein JTE90_027399 [Oedothorax gibbosus]|uniref:EF-hand domain-containing protein n=1 Tax=Oedothorax gibbosus TaxID=931172 RepID=A0AAV6VZ76_9ARAC|nr:hypothetical protein JTE90_027399 [Oedothorax gibbosus]